MATATDVLRHAVSTIGYTENPRGSNKTIFAAEAGHANGQPWCATWVVAMMRRAGIKLPSESAYTPWMANAFRSRGLWHVGTAGARPGDVVFFNFNGHGIQHVGIVEKGADEYGRIVTIEGNTSSGDSGSQDNGGGVYRRTRTKQFVVGYGRPTYAAAAALATEVRPMFDPALALEPIVADLACPDGGVWLLAASGAVYAFGGAPYAGAANGKDYFAGRTAARLEAAGGGYRIVATSGETYGPVF